MDELLSSRLLQLRRRGNPGVAPLWAELLGPNEFLALELPPSTPWAALMTARALASVGRTFQAREALAAVTDEGGCIPLLKREVQGYVDSLEPSGGEDRGAQLKGWLDNVMLWRARSISAPGG